MKIIQSYAANFTAAAVGIENPNKIKTRVCVCACVWQCGYGKRGEREGEEELG